MLTSRCFSSLFTISLFFLIACGGGSSSEEEQVNSPPSANAGSDLTVNEEVNVQLNGGASTDDQAISVYSWVQVSGSQVSLSNDNSVTPSFFSPETTVDLELVFQLTVTDTQGASDTDTVVISVLPVNEEPVVSAGADLIEDEQSTVNLFGDASDADGEIVSYLWEQLSGPDVAMIDSDSSNTSFLAPTTVSPIELEFRFTATDNEDSSGSDIVKVSVNPINTPPEVNAGEDQVSDEGLIVSLQGEVSDNDGEISSFQWTQVSGDSLALTDSDTLTPSFVAPTLVESMVFEFELSAEDNEGAISKDRVVIQVMPVNEAPVVNVEADFSLPEQSVVEVSATAGDSDGTIENVLWSQVSGPNIVISSPNKLSTELEVATGGVGEEAILKIEVTDNEGATSSAELRIMIEEGLEFVEYTGDAEPEQFTDITLNILELDESSLELAEQSEQGYSTYVVDGNSSYSFVVKENELIIEGAGAPEFLAGDIIVGVTSGESEAFLRKVTSVEGLIIKTESASIAEAFPNGEVNLRVSLFNEVLEEGKQNKDGASKQSSNILSLNTSMQKELAPGISIVSEIGMDSALDLDLSFSILNGGFTSFKSELETKIYSKAYLQAGWTGSISKKFKHKFAPIFKKKGIITVSGIPLLVSIKGTPFFEASASASRDATVRYGYGANKNIESGFSWENEEFTTFGESSTSFSKVGPEYSVGGGLSTTLEGGLIITVSLYELDFKIPGLGNTKFRGPGISFDNQVYGDFSVSAEYDSSEFPPYSCELDLSVGAKIALQFDYNTIGSLIGVDKSGPFDIFNARKSLWNINDCPFAPESKKLDLVVLNADTMTRLNDADVKLMAPSGDELATSSANAEGVYSFGEVPLSSYKILASKDGFVENSIEVQLSEDSNVNYYIVLLFPEGEGILTVEAFNSSLPENEFRGDLIIRKGDRGSGEIIHYSSFQNDEEVSLATGVYHVTVESGAFIPYSQVVHIYPDEYPVYIFPMEMISECYTEYFDAERWTVRCNRGTEYYEELRKGWHSYHDNLFGFVRVNDEGDYPEREFTSSTYWLWTSLPWFSSPGQFSIVRTDLTNKGYWKPDNSEGATQGRNYYHADGPLNLRRGDYRLDLGDRYARRSVWCVYDTDGNFRQEGEDEDGDGYPDYYSTYRYYEKMHESGSYVVNIDRLAVESDCPTESYIDSLNNLDFVGSVIQQCIAMGKLGPSCELAP